MVRIQSPYPDPDSGLPQKFNRDFLVHGYICDEIFIKSDTITLR